MEMEVALLVGIPSESFKVLGRKEEMVAPVWFSLRVLCEGSGMERGGRVQYDPPGLQFDVFR